MLRTDRTGWLRWHRLRVHLTIQPTRSVARQLLGNSSGRSPQMPARGTRGERLVAGEGGRCEMLLRSKLHADPRSNLGKAFAHGTKIRGLYFIADAVPVCLDRSLGCAPRPRKRVQDRVTDE